MCVIVLYISMCVYICTYVCVSKTIKEEDVMNLRGSGNRWKELQVERAKNDNRVPVYIIL